MAANVQKTFFNTNINIPNNSFIRQFLRYARKYGFPFKVTVFTGIIILCVVVLVLQISRGQPLSQQASLAVVGGYYHGGCGGKKKSRKVLLNVWSKVTKINPSILRLGFK